MRKQEIKDVAGNACKQCSICEAWLSADNNSYDIHRGTTTKLDSACKSCRSIIRKKRTKSHPFETLLAKYKQRAKETKVPFNLDYDYLQSIWTGICPIYKSEISLHNANSFKKNNLKIASLDKLVPTKGYVKGNVTWISLKANLIKQDCTNHLDIYKVWEWMYINTGNSND